MSRADRWAEPDLGAVFDAAGVSRAPLVGLSQGAASAAAYAARYPERVSALVLIGGCARGRRTKRHPAVIEHFERGAQETLRFVPGKLKRSSRRCAVG